MVAVRVSISLEIRFSGESESMREEAPPMDGWMDGGFFLRTPATNSRSKKNLVSMQQIKTRKIVHNV